jgi:hypothetical protein
MLPEAGRARRLDFVQYFRYLRRPERVVVQVLARHQDIVGRTYAQFGLPFEFRCDRLPQQDGHMTVHAYAACQHVIIRVQQLGSTIPTQLDQARRDFWNNAQLEAAYLELPLGQAGAADACAHAERIGFFFSGVGPYSLGDTDALRLQCLKHEPQFSVARVIHPFAQDLLAYIATESARNQRWGLP